MLVLSRKTRESVIVGKEDGIQHLLRVTVLEIGMGTVKLGFEADAAVPVFRQEIWDRMRANGELTGPPGAIDLPRGHNEDIAPQ